MRSFGQWSLAGSGWGVRLSFAVTRNEVKFQVVLFEVIPWLCPSPIRPILDIASGYVPPPYSAVSQWDPSLIKSVEMQALDVAWRKGKRGSPRDWGFGVAIDFLIVSTAGFDTRCLQPFTATRIKSLFLGRKLLLDRLNRPLALLSRLVFLARRIFVFCVRRPLLRL
jgi:hypothetical protein